MKAFVFLPRLCVVCLLIGHGLRKESSGDCGAGAWVWGEAAGHTHLLWLLRVVLASDMMRPKRDSPRGSATQACAAPVPWGPEDTRQPAAGWGISPNPDICKWGFEPPFKVFCLLFSYLGKSYFLKVCTLMAD